MLSAEDIEILRSIARAGSDYDAIKRLLAETQWEIEEDEVDLGFLRISSFTTRAVSVIGLSSATVTLTTLHTFYSPLLCCPSSRSI